MMVRTRVVELAMKEGVDVEEIHYYYLSEDDDDDLIAAKTKRERKKKVKPQLRKLFEI